MTEFFSYLDKRPQYNKQTPLNYTIESKAKQDLYENINNNINNYKMPNFKYYKDDRNLDLNPLKNSNIRYKNKNLFYEVPQFQNENDEQGLNIAFLNNYYGYRNLGGNYETTYQNIKPTIKKTPKENLFELF